MGSPFESVYNCATLRQLETILIAGSLKQCRSAKITIYTLKVAAVLSNYVKLEIAIRALGSHNMVATLVKNSWYKGTVFRIQLIFNPI